MELSPVIWGMNPSTQTVDVKAKGDDEDTESVSAKEDEAEPEEAKPYRVYEEDGQFCVYKLNMDGEQTGESLGCHESAEEAQAQVVALYANEPKEEEDELKQRGEGVGQGEEPVGDGGADVCACPKCGTESPHEKGMPCNRQECPECGSKMEGKEKEAKAPMKTESDGQHPASHYLVVEDPDKVSTWHLRVRNAEGEPDHRLMGAAWAALHGGYRGNVYEGPGKREAIGKLTRLYASEDMDTPKADDGPEVTVDGVRYVADLGDAPRYDGKAGRVLAARNARRLEAALATLTEILEDAGLVNMEDDDEQEEKGAEALQETDHDAPAEEQAADDAPAEPEAGPVIPPTSERMALLRKLQMELLEVEK